MLVTLNWHLAHGKLIEAHILRRHLIATKPLRLLIVSLVKVSKLLLELLLRRLLLPLTKLLLLNVWRQIIILLLESCIIVVPVKLLAAEVIRWSHTTIEPTPKLLLLLLLETTSKVIVTSEITTLGKLLWSLLVAPHLVVSIILLHLV